MKYDEVIHNFLYNCYGKSRNGKLVSDNSKLEYEGTVIAQHFWNPETGRAMLLLNITRYSDTPLRIQIRLYHTAAKWKWTLPFPPEIQYLDDVEMGATDLTGYRQAGE